MTADAVRRKFTQFGIIETEIDRIYRHWDEQNSERYKSLVKELWPKHKHEEGPPTDAGWHRVPIRIEYRFTQKYYRAIAKIAFHYFLANTPCGFTGREAWFEPIRTFIMQEGDEKQFFDVKKPRIMLPVGVLPDGTALLPRRWMHLLCGIESASSAVVGVYTLFGPERPPSPHFVTLFHRPSPIWLPEHHYGHAYIYGNSDLGDTRAAFVEPIDIQMTR